MEFNYLMPTKIYFGRAAIKKNKEALSGIGKKALIVTGKSSSKRNGSLKDVEEALTDLNISYTIFDDVEENPSLETIEKAADLGKVQQVDFVIGIGGGSPLDAAKAVAVFIKNSEIKGEAVFRSGKLDNIPVVAVPTTSGTGSEVTQYSIVTVHREETKRNLGQIVFPKIAFLDSSYTDHTPYPITVNTAIDAFTHLVESYLSRNATTMSDLYAEKGFELFKICFDRLAKKELTEELREDLMMASMLGGIAIAQSGTALPHGMGYSLTYYHNVPHGLANGVLTVEYLRIFKDRSKIVRMLSLLGLETIQELQDIFDALFTLDLKLSDDEILKYASLFAENKDKLRNHPEEVTMKEIEGICRNSLQ